MVKNEFTYKTVHNYVDGDKTPHIFLTTVLADSQGEAMNFMKSRYPVEDGYKSTLESVGTYEI